MHEKCLRSSGQATIWGVQILGTLLSKKPTALGFGWTPTETHSLESHTHTKKPYHNYISNIDYNTHTFMKSTHVIHEWVCSLKPFIEQKKMLMCYVMSWQPCDSPNMPVRITEVDNKFYKNRRKLLIH